MLYACYKNIIMAMSEGTSFLLVANHHTVHEQLETLLAKTTRTNRVADPGKSKQISDDERRAEWDAAMRMTFIRGASSPRSRPKTL